METEYYKKTNLNKMERIWIGHGNLWKEEDGDMPTCSFCNKDIDGCKGFLGDSSFDDFQCCEKTECRLSLAEQALTEIEIEEEEEEESYE